MTITHKQLEAMTAAEARLKAAGVLSSPHWEPDDEWLEAATKASQQAIRTGLPVILELPSRVDPEAAPPKR